jgi:hypothetical protein
VLLPCYIYTYMHIYAYTKMKSRAALGIGPPFKLNERVRSHARDQSTAPLFRNDFVCLYAECVCVYIIRIQSVFTECVYRIYVA